MAETTTTTTTTTKPEEMDETSERLIKTENYISKILSFIPTNLYVPPPEEEERRHYWTKPTESEKQKMKFESKKAKRLRLDPTSGAADVVEMQQKQKQAQDQVDATDNDLLKEQDRRMPIDIDRTSRTFGGKR